MSIPGLKTTLLSLINEALNFASVFRAFAAYAYLKRAEIAQTDKLAFSEVLYKHFGQCHQYRLRIGRANSASRRNFFAQRAQCRVARTFRIGAPFLLLLGLQRISPFAYSVSYCHSSNFLRMKHLKFESVKVRKDLDYSQKILRMEFFGLKRPPNAFNWSLGAVSVIIRHGITFIFVQFRHDYRLCIFGN
jgi:hypothetical protein